MLLRFRVANFRSLRDNQELSLIAGSHSSSPSPSFRLDELGGNVLRVAAIYGPNAAGKSNMLAALDFLQKVVRDSHRAWKPEGPLPREPFLLDPHSSSEPSLFDLDFLLQGVRYRYGFSIDSEKICGEWLYAFPNGRRRLWFRRDEQLFHFGKSLGGSNRTIARLTRKNSLFLSAAAGSNHPLLLPVYLWFANQFIFSLKREEGFTATLVRDSDSRKSVLTMLQQADLGIIEIDVREEPLDDKIRSIIAILEPDRKDLAEVPKGFLLPVIELRHRAKDPAGVSLPIKEESRGTQAWFALAGMLLFALQEGAILCVDELDSSLHPRLALEVIRLFEDPARNPKNAQLIFNTHDTTLLGNLLGSSGLRRDEIWFVEKDDTGATHIYPLSDFKPRIDENLERGYLQGRYGAVPFITSSPLIKMEDA